MTSDTTHPAGAATPQGWRGRLAGLFAFALGVGLAAISPVSMASLSGSGNLNDVVSLTVSTGSLAASTLTTSGTPIASSTAFNVNDGTSNVDTYILYAWSTTPYYGTTSSQTSIDLRGTTYQIGDLLWFKQAIVSGSGTTTTSQYYAPLLLKNSASITTVTWTSAGNACTAWTGTPAVGFIATAAGTFTFKYHDATTQTDDAPSTTSSYNYCLDTTSSQVYLGTSTAYGSNTLIKVYTTNSVLGILQSYQFEFKPGSYTTGNKYCMSGFTGSGTSATPDLAMCEMMPYSTSGASSAKLTPLFDPPTYFPSGNGLGGNAITYAASGTQWNPYSSSTTNSA
jgi:hypothetical protein